MSDRLFKVSYVDISQRDGAMSADGCTVNCYGTEKEIVVVPVEIVNELLERYRETAIDTTRAVVGQLSNISDTAQVIRIYREFGSRGSAYMKVVNGTTYIIFRSNPRLRSIFTGTRYLASNTKVVSFGFGKIGAAKSIRVGTIWTVVFINAWNISEFFLRDGLTLAELGVQMASDTSKAVISSLAGIGAAALVGGGAVALAPLAVGVVVAVAVGIGLEWVDNKFRA